MPSLHMDLISVGDLDDLGIEMTIKEGSLHLHYNDRPVLTIMKKRNVWPVNTDLLLGRILEVMGQESCNALWWMAPNIEEETANLHVTLADKAAKAMLALYHLRLGHRCERLIIEHVNGGRIKIGNLSVEKLSVAKHSAEHPCQSCALAKSHKLPREARPVQKPTRRVYYNEANPNFKEGSTAQQGFFAGQVSTDMCGPYSIPSFIDNYVGNQNFMLMDSKEVYVYGYVKKSQALSNLKDLIEVKLKHKKLPIESYHSDGAKELIAQDITSYLSKLGVKNTFTTAYTPQENSYMERHFRTECEAIQAMMEYARFIPKNMWFQAKLAFTYIYNRLPTQTARGKMSPFEYRTGHVPDLSNLRVWGCKCYANIDLKLRKKDFAARAMVGYLVGYSDLQRDAYRIWIPQSGKIIVSRDVKFDENIPQGKIDHVTDTYWKEVRTYAGREVDVVRYQIEFEYLVGVSFYDPDLDAELIVTRLGLVGKAKNIVAYVRRVDPSGAMTDEEDESIHVAEVENLLGTYYEERNLSGEAMSAVKSGPLFTVDGTPSDSEPTEEKSSLAVEHPNTLCSLDRRVQGSSRNERVDGLKATGTELILPISGVYDLNKLSVEVPCLTGVDYNEVLNYLSENVIDPKTYREAIMSSDKDEWRKAIANEIDNLRRKGVTEEIPRPANLGRMIGTKYVFKTKFKHGKIDKYKARIVAKGYRQIKDVDYSETFVPVARMNTFRFFLVISVYRGHVRIQIDFIAAFLDAPVVEDIYIETPEQWDVAPGNVLKLKKALYGLKQAGRSWYQVLKDFLIREEKFTMCLSDHCVFTRDNGNIMLLIYVDDLIISSLDPLVGEKLLAKIKSHFEIGEESNLEWYIGMAVKDTGSSVVLSQSNYIVKAIEKYGYDKKVTADSPMKENYVIEKKPDDELFEEENIRSKIGTLMFTAVCVRPDIAFAVNYLARFTIHPSAEVCKAIDRVFHYLNGTPDYGVHITKGKDLELVVYSDSDLAGGGNDMKSVSGVVAYLGGNLICWYATKQATIAQSSCESEILAMNFAAKEIVWLRGFLDEMGVKQDKPTRLLGDNQSAINLTYNPVFHKRTKHVMIKIKFLMECVQTDQILLEFVRTHLNYADCMTKMQKLAHFKVALDTLRMRA